MSEHRLNFRNHSSKSEQNTRVKVKPRKKTVGITLPQNLIKRTREHGLNISRITEQALSSILDYLETQNNEKSSQFLSEGSFPKKVQRAGSSVWYERRLRKAEAAGSNPARSTKSSFEKEVLPRKFLSSIIE